MKFGVTAATLPIVTMDAPGRHQRGQRLDAEQRAGRVHAEDPLPVDQLDVQQPGQVRESRVVDQAVHLPVPDPQLGREPGPRGGVGHVELPIDDPVTVPVEFAGHDLGRGDEVRGHHDRPFGGQRARLRSALALCRARDDDDLSRDPTGSCRALPPGLVEASAVRCHESSFAAGPPPVALSPAAGSLVGRAGGRCCPSLWYLRTLWRGRCRGNP